VNSHIHLDAELLAAWSEGSLPKDQAARVDEHLADCSSCQEMLAVFARTEPPSAEGSGFPGLSNVEGRRTWWHWRWAIPIAAAATVAAIWVAIPQPERTAQLNPTAAPAVAETPAPGMANDAVAPGPQEKPESKSPPPQRVTPPRSRADEADKETPAAKTEQFETRSAPAVREREQDAPPAAPAVPAQSRLEAQGLVRQAAAEVVSPDPLVRWRITAARQLERSTDGGQTWTAVSLPDQVMAAGVAAPTATTAIVTASDGRQFRTADQGKTWNLVQP